MKVVIIEEQELKDIIDWIQDVGERATTKQGFPRRLQRELTDLIRELRRKLKDASEWPDTVQENQEAAGQSLSTVVVDGPQPMSCIYFSCAAVKSPS